MDAEKFTRLEAVLSRLHARWGVSAVRLLHTTEPSVMVTTGFPTLAVLLAPDGIPPGAVTELLGGPTSGMTTLAYALLHQALDYQTPASVYFKQGERPTDKSPILLS